MGYLRPMRDLQTWKEKRAFVFPSDETYLLSLVVSVPIPLDSVSGVDRYPEQAHCCESWLIEDYGVHEPWDSGGQDHCPSPPMALSCVIEAGDSD